MWFIGFAEGDGCFHTDEEDTDSGSFLAKQRKAYYIIECKIDLVLVACNVLLCVLHIALLHRKVAEVK